MVRVACTRMIIFTVLLASFHVKAFSVQTLPQVLRSSARRLAPSEQSGSFTSSSASSSPGSSSAQSSSSSSSSGPSSPGSAYAGEEPLSSAEISEDYDTHPQYSFSYSLKDLSAGDDKQQEEKRDGDTVQGKYSLIESSGLHQTFEYTPNNDNGFNTIQSNNGKNTIRQHHSETQPQLTKPVKSNTKSSFNLARPQQSTASISYNEQRLSRPQAIALAKRFPATVLGQRVQTTYVNHAPTLFNPGPEGAVLAGNSEDDFKALRNTGNTYIERFQHPRTIIEHRPSTTYITQFTPGPESLSLLRNTYH